MDIKKNILIVDDENDICDIVAQELEFSGFNAITALDGEQAFQIYNSRPIDGIISDFHMPKKSGIDLLQLVREINKEVFFVLMITDPSAEEEKLAKELNATLLISKPVSAEDIAQICLKHFGA